MWIANPDLDPRYTTLGQIMPLYSKLDQIMLFYSNLDISTLNSTYGSEIWISRSRSRLLQIRPNSGILLKVVGLHSKLDQIMVFYINLAISRVSD